MKRTAIFLTLVVIILLAHSALAMSSTSYQLDWFTPLTSGGGGPSSSASYATNVTAGQSAIGSLSSASYRANLGYWYSTAAGYKIYLPVTLRR